MIDNRENNIWTVYIHIVPKSISGYDYDKYYVGITSKSVEERWNNGRGYSGQPFYNAIKKYGWDNIEHYIIANHLTEDEAKKFEKTLINKLQCKGKYGYNLTDGGDGTLGYIPTKEEREYKSKKYSGKGNPYYGKKHSEETKRKISKHHADVSGINNPFRKNVYQFTIDGEYVNKYCSCNEAGRTVGLKNGSSISNAALKHRISANYLWEYEDNIVIKDNIIKIKNYKYSPKRKTTKCVFVFDKNTKKLLYNFESCIVASQQLKISPTNITGYARYKYKNINYIKSKYIFRYKEDVGFNKNGEAYFIE